MVDGFASEMYFGVPSLIALHNEPVHNHVHRNGTVMLMRVVTVILFGNYYIQTET